MLRRVDVEGCLCLESLIKREVNGKVWGGVDLLEWFMIFGWFKWLMGFVVN